ncbi:MAG: TauD/TfdA family dioxygenase [Pseudomonadota bacterium]
MAAPSFEHIDAKRLTGTFGARVEGVDCASVSNAEWNDILSAFHRYHVLVFPDQTLEPQQHAAFMERFGELDVHPQELSASSTLPLPGFPKVELMENRPGTYGPRASAWHTDVTFRPRPPAVTSLYGVQTPVGCADTVWSNLRLVLEQCSDGMRATLRQLKAIHATAFVRGAAQAGSINYDPTKEADPRKHGLEAQYREPVAHPIVHWHEAGFETLYINPAFVSGIEGWTEEESKVLLGWLYEQAMHPNFTYRHQWSARDLVLWDNRCTMHYGVNDYDEEDTRILHRTTGGPFEVRASA